MIIFLNWSEKSALPTTNPDEPLTFLTGFTKFVTDSPGINFKIH